MGFLILVRKHIYIESGSLVYEGMDVEETHGEEQVVGDLEFVVQED